MMMKKLFAVLVLVLPLSVSAALVDEEGIPYVRPVFDNADWSRCLGEGWTTAVSQPLSRAEYDRTYSGEPEYVYDVGELCRDEYTAGE
jgi:hypothetical protein